MKILFLVVGSIVVFSVTSPDIIVGGVSKPRSVQTTGTVFKQEIKPIELKGSPDHNIQPATNYIQPMRSTK